MRACALALLFPLLLCACAPKSDPPVLAPLALDCALPFEVQAAKLTAQPHLVPAPKEPGEPYRFYSTEGGSVSYVITEKGAPGHPAILMQTAGGGQVKTTGCPYGDKKGYEKVLAYIDSLKPGARR
ncbi:MAG TPA: hypothetical protein VGH86_01715 [Phenylobacterium sp.]